MPANGGAKICAYGPRSAGAGGAMIVAMEDRAPLRPKLRSRALDNPRRPRRRPVSPVGRGFECARVRELMRVWTR